jgi:hypothetical protein
LAAVLTGLFMAGEEEKNASILVVSGITAVAVAETAML